MGLIPGSGRLAWGGHGNPLQCSCLENPVDRGAWRATVHGVTQSQMWLSTHVPAWLGLTAWWQEQGKTPGAGREEDDKNNIYRLYCSAQAGPTTTTQSPPCLLVHSESPMPPGPLYVLFKKRPFGCGAFLKPLLNLLQCCFCFQLWFFGQKACGILASQPGMEPATPALKGEILTTGPQGKSHLYDFRLFSQVTVTNPVLKNLAPLPMITQWTHGQGHFTV